MKLLLFAASLREGSFNKKLIRIAEEMVKKEGITADLADFSEFSAPLYNADIQNTVGFPPEITLFKERLQNSDGLIISSPEYNFSTPGTLKNLIDWVSRMNPVPWKKSVILLMSASPSLVGGNRGLWTTRIPLEACGAFLFPDMFSLSSADSAFDETGALKNKDLEKRLHQNIVEFISYVQREK